MNASLHRSLCQSRQITQIHRCSQRGCLINTGPLLTLEIGLQLQMQLLNIYKIISVSTCTFRGRLLLSVSKLKGVVPLVEIEVGVTAKEY